MSFSMFISNNLWCSVHIYVWYKIDRSPPLPSRHILICIGSVEKAMAERQGGRKGIATPLLSFLPREWANNRITEQYACVWTQHWINFMHFKYADTQFWNSIHICMHTQGAFYAIHPTIINSLILGKLCFFSFQTDNKKSSKAFSFVFDTL